MLTRGKRGIASPIGVFLGSNAFTMGEDSASKTADKHATAPDDAVKQQDARARKKPLLEMKEGATIQPLPEDR